MQKTFERVIRLCVKKSLEKDSPYYISVEREVHVFRGRNYIRIFIFLVYLLKKPYSKPLECKVVYIPVTTLSQAT